MREVPFKNYIILSFVVLLTVLGTFYLRGWYNASKEYYASNSVMTKIVREIKVEEISNYTLENQKFIIYISSGMNSELKDFEDDFKNLVQKLDIQDDILYLNLDNTTGVYDVLENFASDDTVKDLIKESPASIYMFNNGKITSVTNSLNSYSMKRLEVILKKWSKTNA